MKEPIKTVWAQNAQASAIHIDNEKEKNGWSKLYVPEDYEFNYIEQNLSDAIQNIAQELCSVLKEANLSPSKRDSTKPPYEDKDKTPGTVLKAIKNIIASQTPLGTIQMYNGTGWVDNSTIPGWYSCTSENTSLTYQDASGTTQHVPNLTDKFIKGSTTSGESGGDLNIKVKHLPELVSGRETIELATQIEDGRIYNERYRGFKYMDVYSNTDRTYIGTNAFDVFNLEDEKPPIIGKNGEVTGNNQVPFLPPFYTLIYIIKVK